MKTLVAMFITFGLGLYLGSLMTSLVPVDVKVSTGGVGGGSFTPVSPGAVQNGPGTVIIMYEK